MTVRIKPKRGTGAPTTGDLENNEIAIDQSSGILYVRDGGTNIVEVGKDLVHDSSPQLGSDLELDNNYIQNDGNAVLNVDNGSLQLYHMGDLQIETLSYATDFKKDIQATQGFDVNFAGGIFGASQGYEHRFMRVGAQFGQPSLTIASAGRPMGDDISAQNILADREYEIISSGDTDFTDFGADDNNPGTVFTANRAGDSGDGTGTVALSEISMPTDVQLDFSLFDGSVSNNAKTFNPMRVSTYHGGYEDNRGYIHLAVRTPNTDDEIDATQILEDVEYEITSSGSTDFTDFGADDNNPGTQFVANRAGDSGDGTGTVAPLETANTKALELKNDGGTIVTLLQGEVEVRDKINQPLRINIGDQNLNLTNTTEMDPATRTNHDMVRNTIDFTDYTPDDDTAYKQNFNFRVEGDEIPNSGSFNVGRIEVGYVHNEPLKHYARLNVEDEQQEGQNYIEANVKQVLTNAPVKFARIQSGTTDPTTGLERGQYFFNTTSKQLKLYTGATPAWTDISEDGQQFYDSTANRMLMRIDGAWHSVDTTAL